MKNLMQKLASSVDAILRKRVGHKGFAILAFDFETPDTANYVSNARRKDIIIAFRAAADRLERKEDLLPPINTTIQ